MKFIGSNSSVQMTKYRIIYVVEDPIYGTYYECQEHRRFLFFWYWHTISWDNGSIREFRSPTFPMAKRQLDKYKDKCTYRVVYEE